MGRYRPPEPPKTALITPAGYARLQEEMNFLWKVKRPEITRKVSEAAAQGDRSENADYIYGKRRLREIDGRVRYLTKRLEDATIVEDKPRDPSKVFFSAWVTVEDEDTGQEHVYRLVGSDEIDPALNCISIDGPMAQALVGKSIDDEVIVKTPAGERCLVITAIRY